MLFVGFWKFIDDFVESSFRRMVEIKISFNGLINDISE